MRGSEAEVKSCENREPGGFISGGMSGEPIAIVGIGCRFPGGVTDPESLWRLLRNRTDAIAEIPSNRIDTGLYYDPHPASPGKMNTRWGGFLEHVDMFDAAFFGISPREAERMDPQQRLLLEVAWEALEDAGQPPDLLAGSLTGVFIGLWLNDYETRLFADPAAVDFYMTTGTGRYSASGRLSYVLGLEGPSMTIDTACSSSLVAVHLACQSLRRNECSMALAGGANVILQPHISIAYSQSKMMAPDGRCKFADAGANGYVRSEGAGVVVLKPLSRALSGRDPIYAVIRGSAVNNDGRTSGYMTTPAREGQEKMLSLAYRNAGLSPGRVRYVEAHGTGTVAGDPVELTALGNVLSSGRPAGSTCYVGSVKTNVGHTEGAAGIAGLIKTALVLKHRSVPANLHLRELTPAVQWDRYPLVIPRELTRLAPDSEPATAGVSAFGIAGTNAHAVLAEAPKAADEDARPHPDQAILLPLSARSPEALASLAQAYISALEEDETPALYDLSYTAALRRSHHEHRLAVAAGTRAGIIEPLRAFLRGESPPDVWTGRAEPESKPKIVFVCPGQGSQWPGMGRQLFREEPVFREWIQRCERVLTPYVDWSLQEQLHLDPDSPAFRLNDIDVIQPALFAVQIALAALWRSWGVEPDAVVGHSMGELAGAFLAGALSLEDAARVISTRSRLLRRISGRGSMAVVALPVDQARGALAGFENRVSVAVSNSPRSTVLSGDPSALHDILETLRSRDIFCRPVKVDVASHSPQVDVLTDDLVRELSAIQPRDAKVPMYSTVTAERIEGRLLEARYWTRNLRSPVLFSQTVQKLAADQHTVFIELSPHPVLTASIDEACGGAGRRLYAISSLERERDERVSLLSSAGRLYTIGCSLDWSRLFPVPGRAVSLPAYPWQRQRFWLEPKSSQTPNDSVALTALNGHAHPLLGARLPQVASQPRSIVWQNDAVAGCLPFSEAACLEMASAAAVEVFGPNLHRISDITIDRVPGWTANSARCTQFILNTDPCGQASFEVFCRAPALPAEWSRCASGRIDRGEAKGDWIYELSWKLKALERSAPGRPPGRWLILADRGGVGAAVAAALASRGQNCVVVFADEPSQAQEPGRLYIAPGKPDALRQLLGAIAKDGGPPCHGIVSFWGLDSGSAGCDSALRLVQSLAQTEWRPAKPRLWLITMGAQAVEPADGRTLALEQAPLWGLGRVIALEHPDLFGGLIDLEPSSAGAAAVCGELLGSDEEDQVALRAGRRYVPRLERSRPAAMVKPLVVAPDATYLITGGLGSLGLRLARWLVTRGARHLVLTGRSGLPERSAWGAIPPDSETGRRVAAIEALEQSGATVYVAKTDAADRRAVSELWAELDAHHPPVRGIIHAAGILTPCNVVDLEPDAFHAVIRSKVDGGRLLHEFAGRTERLDFFVLFSSAASVWGSHSLAHYAAANHYLDALALHRAALGLPALSVNWGWWEGEGLVSAELAALFRSVGLQGLPSDGALETLAWLLGTGTAQKIVAGVDWNVFRPIFEARRKRPLLENLSAHPKEPAQPETKEERRYRVLEEIQQAPPVERTPRLHDYIRAQVAQVLGFASPDRVDPRLGFFRMGMDSIMTVQLRNRLENALGCPLPPTAAFEYPTVNSLTGFLAATVLQLNGNGASLAAPAGEEPEPAVAGQEQLSEDQLMALLARKLEEVG